MMHIYSVGKLYHPDRTAWPESSQYNFRGGDHELVLFYSAPTQDEVIALRRGRAEFALIVEGPVILLCYRFSPGFWSDAPYSWHLVSGDERTIPSDLIGDSRVALHVILVDASTGVILALRMVTLSPAFSRALHAAIRLQCSKPWDSAAYDAALRGLYADLSSEQLASRADICCVGGE